MVKLHTPSIILLHRFRLGAFAREFHFFRIGRAEAKSYAAICVYLRRDQRRQS